MFKFKLQRQWACSPLVTHASNNLGRITGIRLPFDRVLFDSPL